MSLVVTYYMPADATLGPWTEDLSGAVRLGSVDGIVDMAKAGEVGTSSLLFDDPDATLGTSHYPDGIRGLKRVFVDEDRCPAGDQRIHTGWFGDRHYRRGTDSLRLGVARKVDATIVDSNTILSFRVFAPHAIAPANEFIRPAETDIERVTALLAVPFLSSLHDLGLVATTGGVDMDACDYTGQHPVDVLTDCMQQSGRNFFVTWDPTAFAGLGAFSLFYNKNEEPIFDSALQISNVLADVDGVTTFAPAMDSELTRTPERISAAVYLPFTGGTSYRTRIQTEYDYSWRDSSAPSANVKTQTKADARADRFLQENSTEDDLIICTIKLPAALVTGIKAGHRVLSKFSHLPGMETWRWCRVLQRTVMANEETDEFYNVRLEMTPLPSIPQGAFAQRTVSTPAQPTLPHVTTPGRVLMLIATGSLITGSSIPAPDLLDPNTMTTDSDWNVGAAWTQAYWDTQNGGPGGSACLGLWWRRVRNGEVTASPVAVDTTVNGGAWLWEFDTATDPGAGDTFTTGLPSSGPSGTHIASDGSEVASVGGGLSGFRIGAMAYQMTDYEVGPTIVVTDGTEVQNCDCENDPMLVKEFWYPPWVWVATNDAGAVGATSTFNVLPPGSGSVCTGYGVAGVALELPGVTSVPTIPFPANQVGT